MNSVSQTIVKKKMITLVRAAVIEMLEKEGFTLRNREPISVADSAADLLESITPKKGVHYNDGIDGENGADGEDGIDGQDGEDGINGVDADEDAIIKSVIEQVMAKIKPPRDGNDGRDADEAKIIRAVKMELMDFLKKKKFGIADIEGLELALSNARGSKKGGQGKTYAVFVGSGITTADNTTFTFTQPPLESEMAVYRGGGRIFKENGDYTIVAFPGGRVKSITLAFALANGENINIRTKG